MKIINKIVNPTVADTGLKRTFTHADANFVYVKSKKMVLFFKTVDTVIQIKT